MFVAHSEEKQVVQLANKAKLWPHMQSASLVSALHTNSICYMVVYYHWLTHFNLLNRVFTFMLWWCRCVPYVKLCLCHLCVFLNAEKSHQAKTYQIYVDSFRRFLHICDVKAVSDRWKINQNIILKKHKIVQKYQNPKVISGNWGHDSNEEWVNYPFVVIDVF